MAFLGGTIGNLLPAERAEFLAGDARRAGAGDWLLLGTDLVKDPAVLVPAYDDAAGVTAEFNRNVLRVINRELGADFDPEAFDHVAVWDADHEWIEMRLRATGGRCGVRVLDLTGRLRRGGGAAHRGVGEVPPGGDRRGAGRGRLRHRGVLDRPGRALRRHAGAGAVSLFTRLGRAGRVIR